MTNQLARLREVRRSLDALRVALHSPAAEEMECYLSILEESVQSLASIELEIRGQRSHPDRNIPGESELLIGREIAALAHELETVRRLAQQGASFCDGWARMLGGAAGGYIASGEAAPLNAAGTVSLKG